MPPHYHGYDRGFIRWLAVNHEQTDFLSDDDLDRIASGAALARAYDLIVFSGHEEYVTGHEYDLIERYRDLGGNLAFLSANDFFYKVVKHGDRWTAAGAGATSAGPKRARRRPVRRLEPRRVSEPPVHRDRRCAGALALRGTDLHDGARFGVYGIEVDAPTTDSPPGTRVLARIPGIFGPARARR